MMGTIKCIDTDRTARTRTLIKGSALDIWQKGRFIFYKSSFVGFVPAVGTFYSG